MCGRFSMAAYTGLKELFDVDIDDLDLKPRYNIAPTQMVLTVVNNGSNQPALSRWGLIPFWAKDPAIGSKLINARAETLDEKPSFKYPLQERRCLVIADGFYEWQKKGKSNTPFRITLKDQSLFAFAGLWDCWHSPRGENINSCTIITTKPNSLIESIHNRMPVILSRDSMKAWLDPRITDAEFLKGLLQPYPSELMQAYEVSSLVNSPKNDVPECITPVANLF